MMMSRLSTLGPTCAPAHTYVRPADNRLVGSAGAAPARDVHHAGRGPVGVGGSIIHFDQEANRDPRRP